MFTAITDTNTIDIRTALKRLEYLKSLKEGIDDDFSGNQLDPEYSAQMECWEDDYGNECEQLESLQQQLYDLEDGTLMSRTAAIEHVKSLLPEGIPNWISINWDATVDECLNDNPLVTVFDRDYWVI